MRKRPFRVYFFLPLLVLMLETAQAQEKEPSGPANAEPSASVPNMAENVVLIQLHKPSLEEILPLSLSRAVELALERNPALTVEKIRLEQAREKIQAEKGFYDPLLNFRTSIGRRDNVVASSFYPAGFYVDDEQGYGLGLEAKTYTGGRFNLGLDYKKLASSSNTQTLSPQYSANFAFTFTHALLRDFGWGVNMTRIRVAEKGEAIAASNLSQRVAQLIRQVEEIYWSVVFLLEDLGLKKQSLKIARELLIRNQDLLRAGRVAPVSVTEARSGVAAREEGVITAESEVNKFEDRLKLLLHVDMEKVMPSPSDRPEQKTMVVDTGQSIEIALKNRPEINALEREVEQRELEQKFAANQTLPRLDFTAQYGMAGLSGKPNSTCTDPRGIDPITGLPIACNPVGSRIPGSIFEGETRGKDAFDKFFTRNPFDNWSVEVKLQIPLWNRTAKAQLAEANLRLAETKTQLRTVRDQIAVEVRDAIRETLTAWKRIEASRETVKFIEEQLDGMKRRFDAGLTTTYEVLQVLEDLDKAKTSENRAVLDYNIGQSKIRLAEGSVLEKYNIELKKPPRYIFQDEHVVP